MSIFNRLRFAYSFIPFAIVFLSAHISNAAECAQLAGIYQNGENASKHFVILQPSCTELHVIPISPEKCQTPRACMFNLDLDVEMGKLPRGGFASIDMDGFKSVDNEVACETHPLRYGSQEQEWNVLSDGSLRQTGVKKCSYMNGNYRPTSIVNPPMSSMRSATGEHLDPLVLVKKNNTIKALRTKPFIAERPESSIEEYEIDSRMSEPTKLYLQSLPEGKFQCEIPLLIKRASGTPYKAVIPKVSNCVQI